MTAARRDWTHGIAVVGAETTFCGRVIVRPEMEPLDVRDLGAASEVNCPTCMPRVHALLREIEEDAKIAPEVLAMRAAWDILPFLPLLRTELLAAGFGCVDWAEDVVSRRGFYVVALRQVDSSIASPFWIRYRRPPAGQERQEELVQLSWEQPLDNRPQITLTADARFIARVLWGIRDPLPV